MTQQNPLSAHERTRNVQFKNPHSLWNKIARLLWRITWIVLFRPTPPRLMQAWRRLLLRLFRARIGRAYVHPSVRIWAPWKLEIGSDVYIDERVYLYNAYGIRIADRVIISYGAFLCTASHDYNDPALMLIGGPIDVGSDAWIAADAFVSPNVCIGDGAVIGARAVVTKGVEPWTVVAGNPATQIKKRVLSGEDVSLQSTGAPS